MPKILCFITLFFSLSISAQEVQLSWQKDLNTAKELANAEGKLVLVYFTKTDCEVCQLFYTDFFKQDEFKKVSDSFVLAILDGTKKDIQSNDLEVIKQRRWVMQYNKASEFPAVLVIDSKGHEEGKIMTATSQDAIQNYWDFLETIK